MYTCSLFRRRLSSVESTANRSRVDAHYSATPCLSEPQKLTSSSSPTICNLKIELFDFVMRRRSSVMRHSFRWRAKSPFVLYCFVIVYHLNSR
jgi:hypothetical protein